MQLACRRSERYVLLIVSPLSPSIQQSPSQLRRTIYVSAVRHFPKAAIKFPVTVNILFPHCDEPYRFEFVSYKDFSDFLEPQSILRALSPGSKNIRARNIKDLDPTKAYEIVGPGYIYLGQERRPLKDQVWDTSRVFEEKSKLALKVKLQKDHPGLVDLPRVICDKATGKNVAEWEAVFQLSDGSIIFLESKYRMTLVSESIFEYHTSGSYAVFTVRAMLINKRAGWPQAS